MQNEMLVWEYLCRVVKVLWHLPSSPRRGCVSYILLHNKLSHHLRHLKQQTCIISHSFWSGIWEPLSWMVLAHSFSWSCSPDIIWLIKLRAHAHTPIVKKATKSKCLTFCKQCSPLPGQTMGNLQCRKRTQWWTAGKKTPQKHQAHTHPFGCPTPK